MSRSLVFRSFIPTSPERLFALHARPEALRRLSPPFPPVRSVEQDGAFEEGTTVRIRIGIGPLVASWLALLVVVEPGRRFVDVQREGPFREWRHEHRFLPAHGGCEMRDEVTWASRRGLEWLDPIVIAPLLRGYFKKRHQTLVEWVSEENEQKSPGGPRVVTEKS